MPHLKSEEIVKALGEVNETLKRLCETNALLSERLSSLEERSERKEEIRVKTTEEISSKTPSETSEGSRLYFPIPFEYREVVDTVLNKHFDIEVTALSDRPAFEFAIIVPEKYSNMPPAQKAMYGADKRLKVISYAEGTNGVRDWAEKVLNNLNSDLRSMVVADRAKL